MLAILNRFIHREYTIDLAAYFRVATFFLYFLTLLKIKWNTFDFCILDINRRGLERCDVRRYSSLWRRGQYRRTRLRLFYYPLHMRQLYPLSKRDEFIR